MRLVEAQQECLLPDRFGISSTVTGGLNDAAAMVAIGTRVDEVGTLIAIVAPSICVGMLVGATSSNCIAPRLIW